MQRVEPPWQPLLAEALVLADRREEAPREAEAYAALAAGGARVARSVTPPGCARCVAPRERGDRAAGGGPTHFAASNARLELARCLTELGARRRAAGERRAARAILRDAHDAAHACRATALCERARAELLLAGGRPRPPAGAGADALTPRSGAWPRSPPRSHQPRDRAPLYLSPKTVEMHLRSAYRKLDLPGRDGLATALH